VATLRQLRADDTRRRIFSAACHLFAQQSYAATTVDQITQRAGVAKGTFFLHFGTKDAVITELVARQVDRAMAAGVRARARGADPIEVLRALVNAVGEQTSASRGLSRAALAAMMEDPKVGGIADELMLRLFADMIEEARAAKRLGLLRPGADPEQLAQSLMSSLLGASLHFCATPRARPIVQLLAPLIDANLAGFVKQEIPDDQVGRLHRRRQRAQRRRLR
jgi:AcrR family transcriptional regulator